MLVVPVVEDPSEGVGVARWDSVEEASGDDAAAVREARVRHEHLRLARSLWEVEDDSSHLRLPAKQGHERRPVPAAHVDDRLAVAPVEVGEPVDLLIAAARHRAVERGTLVGVLREPGPEVRAEPARERGLAASERVAGLSERLVPDAAEEVGEVAPRVVAIREQELGHCRVAEDARLFLCEDAVARQRAEEPVQGILVDTCLRCELGDRPRPVSELVGDTVIRDEPERLCRHRAADERPHLRLDGRLAHERSAAIAPATSSASSSVSVRQSSNVRPSRTIATTGGSPSRNLAASSSSTAHA